MVCFDNLPGDSKPETCAAGLVRYERKKDLFRLLGSHTTAIVMDGDLDGFIYAYLKASSRGELQDV